MLTENQIRSLLVKAGDTVDVDPAAPRITAVPPRPWRTAAAAFAVAATVAGIAGVSLWLTGDEDGTGGDRTESPAVLDGVPEGTVPSVFAHTRASATEMLQDMGLQVQFRDEISCDPAGRVIGTEPATGTPVEPSDTVTLLLAHQGATTDCAADLSEPWAFVDFATGRGPAPQFADEVRLFVDGRPTGTLPGSEAAKGEWATPSALGELRAATEQVLRLNGEFLAPTLEVREGTPPNALCDIPRPALLGSREALTLTIDIPVDGQFHCPARVSLYRTDGRIDTVVAWTERPLGSAPQPQRVPDVEGLPLAEARDAVTLAGFTARVEELETCHPRQGVVEQAPKQQDLEDDFGDDPTWSGVVTLVVEVPHTTRDCAALDEAAQGFIRFARGGTPPLWADQVQQLLGYAPQAQIPAENAGDPAAWSLCSGVAPEDCRLSPLVVIANSPDVRADEERENNECELIDLGGLPSGLSWQNAIHLFPTGVEGCDEQWAVAIWIADTGAITAVNLLVPEGP